ncbi:hypothetical protein BB561_006572 [Smittium simulii]|uniref:Uncharacterized protein n=1 Tax=Smittium simulii TaxID=133385 RepID=A0A2T9Y360_9FUNG|nr:hypothetical protein BB561_006572 [Smittium simulii]
MIQQNIRQIYNAIELNRFSAALEECNSLLSKNKNSSIIKALKSYVLISMKKREEAETLADQVLNSKPNELKPDVINALSLVYRNLGQNFKLEKLYSKASELYPKIENYAVEWFMSCARSFDLNNQSKAAYKHSKDHKEKSLSLTLARKLCDKASESNWIETRAESQYDAIIKLLESNSGQYKIVAENPDLRVSHLKALKSANQHEKLFKQSLEYMEISNNWDEYLLGISVLSLDGINKSSLEEKTRHFEKLFIKWSDDPIRKRNASLAKLEILAQNKCKNSEIIVNQIWEYFDNFSTKPICFSDLSCYLQLFLAKGKVFNVWDDSSASIFSNLEKMIWLTADIAIFNGYNFIVETDLEKFEFITKTAFNIDQSLVNKDYISDIIILAFFYAIKHTQLAQTQNNTKEIHSIYYNLLSLIEAEIEKNSSYYQFKFLAIRIYLYLGAYNRALELYSLLSIKNIQNDSLGFWILGQGVNIGNYQEDLDQQYNAIQTYESNKIDTPSMVSLAYEHSSYDKVVEFVELNDQISHSLEGANILNQAMQVEILTHENPEELVQVLSDSNLSDSTSLEPDFFASLHDNRDLTTGTNLKKIL